MEKEQVEESLVAVGDDLMTFGYEVECSTTKPIIANQVPDFMSYLHCRNQLNFVSISTADDRRFVVDTDTDVGDDDDAQRVERRQRQRQHLGPSPDSLRHLGRRGPVQGGRVQLLDGRRHPDHHRYPARSGWV